MSEGDALWVCKLGEYRTLEIREGWDGGLLVWDVSRWTDAGMPASISAMPASTLLEEYAGGDGALPCWIPPDLRERLEASARSERADAGGYGRTRTCGSVKYAGEEMFDDEPN